QCLAEYWHALWRLEAADGQGFDEWEWAADVAAYRFTIGLQAWKRFCGELQIDPDQLRKANHPTDWLLDFCEERMPGEAPTQEALAARLRQMGVEDPQPITAETLLTTWRRILGEFRGCGP